MKKHILIAFGVLFTIPSTLWAAQNWSLSGIDIIPRNYWIEDQSIIFKKTQTQTPVMTDTDQDDTGTKTESKLDTINTYLRQVFPEQFILDEIIGTIDNKELKRARGYQNNKTHIIVHHTVNNLDDIKTPEDALKTINAIFKFHTQTRARGDVGYNFIIDPRGNIYEGRGGGQDVMGAHAKYNNAPSLGVALLGNFEINEPTDKQLEALTRLSTALMIKYRINPNNQVYVHIEDDHYPYVKDDIHDAFMGHRDAGKTSCPGKNLYNKLPQIQKNIQQELVKKNMLFPTRPLRYIYNSNKQFFAEKDTVSLSIPYPLNSAIRGCKTNSKSLRVRNCKSDGKTIQFTLTKKEGTLGPDMILLDFGTRNKGLYRISFKTTWASDQKILLEKRRATYTKKAGALPTPNPSEKIKEVISSSDLKTITNKKISVLLYEASTNATGWKFLCQNCTVTDNQGNKYLDKIFSISSQGNTLTYTSKTQTKSDIISFVISTNKPDSRIFITTYDRKSYGGIARNNFYGDITISSQKIKKIEEKDPVVQYSLVNTVTFDQYMRGIIESNDSEPVEKMKTMAILSKNYISYYLSPVHRHPSIPEGVNYNAVDDARIFQKYVGAGVDDTLTKWKGALEATKGQFVMYKNNLAFLPYFSCSAGFTWSAKEKRGWTDTPYLQSVVDPDYCTDFAGHGVGLAGKGATHLANKGLKYNEIIQYYYSGTNLVNIQ